MAKRILVPLDRTLAGEAVLPVIAELARGAGSTVRLLCVERVPDNVVSHYGRVVAYADQEMARLEAEALSYLDAVAVSLDGLPIERVIRFGDPVEETLLEADVFGADLIATTVPRGGWLTRVFSRSVGPRVFRKAKVPVLLFRESSS